MSMIIMMTVAMDVGLPCYRRVRLSAGADDDWAAKKADTVKSIPVLYACICGPPCAWLMCRERRVLTWTRLVITRWRIKWVLDEIVYLQRTCSNRSWRIFCTTMPQLLTHYTSFLYVCVLRMHVCLCQLVSDSAVLIISSRIVTREYSITNNMEGVMQYNKPEHAVQPNCMESWTGWSNWYCITHYCVARFVCPENRYSAGGRLCVYISRALCC